MGHFTITFQVYKMISQDWKLSIRPLGLNYEQSILLIIKQSNYNNKTNVIKIKIEMITYPGMSATLFHHRSTGTEKIKLDKKDLHPEALRYIEEYITNSGFKLLDIERDQMAYCVFLIKE